MTARGLPVDEPLRQARVRALRTEADKIEAELQAVLYDLWDHLKRPDLFLDEKVCPACRNGKKKRLTCTLCQGQGKRYDVHLELSSTPQTADVLYQGLHLPVRRHGKTPTTDEDALLTLVGDDGSGIVQKLMRYRKLSTMRSIYERIAPAPDGRIRTVFNPAGAYTGRFSSAEAFYVPYSTNLQNLTASEAARDPLFAVRDCIIPPPGMVLLYADLSQAEARVVAALSEDAGLLTHWQDPQWDIHRWTASRIFDCPITAVTPSQRFLGKRSRHALNYGETPFKFMKVVNADADVTGVSVTLAQAWQVYEGYHRLHPNLDQVWWTRVQTKLERDEPITTCFGRSCHFHPRFDTVFENGVKKEVLNRDYLRAAVAYEPQSTIADLLNRGALSVYRDETAIGCIVLHQAHDAILVAAYPQDVEGVAQALQTRLEQPIVVNGITLTVPAEVFVCSRRWSEMTRVR